MNWNSKISLVSFSVTDICISNEINIDYLCKMNMEHSPHDSLPVKITKDR